MSEIADKPRSVPAGREHQADFTKPVPAWLTPILGRMKKLLALPANWNSYGAREVSLPAVAAALKVLDRIMSSNTQLPAVVPSASGGLQLEWHDKGIDLEIYVSPEGECTLNLEDLDANTSWDGTLGAGLARVDHAMERLAQ